MCIKFWTPELIVKMAPESVWTSYVINPYHQSACLYVYPSYRYYATAWFSRSRGNKEWTKELLAVPFHTLSTSYGKKRGDWFFPELLVNVHHKVRWMRCSGLQMALPSRQSGHPCRANQQATGESDLPPASHESEMMNRAAIEPWCAVALPQLWYLFVSATSAAGSRTSYAVWTFSGRNLTRVTALRAGVSWTRFFRQHSHEKTTG
jgi:hypothetical protein